MQINPDSLLTEFSATKKENFNPVEERDHVAGLIADPKVAEALQPFEYVRFLRAGGSGLVFEVRQQASHMSRALKLSRKNAPPKDTSKSNPVNVDLEIEALAMVSHQHITRFYAGTKTEQGHYCIVTELVQAPEGQTAPYSIDEWVNARISPPHAGAPVHVNNVLSGLACLLLGYVSGIRYMHERLQLFHMDIKPGNLLVDRFEVPYVTDLGFARQKKKYRDDEDVPVGFTFGFHHPRLIESHVFRAPSTLAKAQSIIPGKELDARYDLYSFGRTVLALLHLFEERFGERVRANYSFLYLHLLATLILDGRNAEAAGVTTAFSKEFALGVKGDLIREFKLTSFRDVEERIERLLGRRNVEFDVPELNPWYPKQVNHGAGVLNMTPRVSTLANHPAFRRLRPILHLGVIDDTYPGARHTRYAHCLGVASKVCECLQALYNDTENPIFRVLVDEADLRSMIVSALVHDLGQSGFGHELEELHEHAYSHSRVTTFILESPYYLDENKRSLQHLITGKAADEWNLSLNSVLEILGKPVTSPRFAMFMDLLDGPIDCDKMDYLVRDSANCDVPYGAGLDLRRLLRCITALPLEIKKHRALRLGVKEKGLPSSEGIAFARRQMYQAVYLQHTSRVTKAMILTGCAQAHFGLVEALEGRGASVGVKGAQASQEELPFRDPIESTVDILANFFACHLIGTAPTFDALAKKNISIIKRFQSSWAKIVEGAKSLTVRELGFDRSVSFFYGFMDERSRRLLSDCVARRIYKRLWDRSFVHLNEMEVSNIRTKLAWSKRQKFLEDLAGKLRQMVVTALGNRSAITETLNILPPELGELENMERHVLIADVPMRPLGPGGAPPPVIRDIDRKSGEYAYVEGMGHIWSEGAEKMVREITFVRVFCEPRFHEILTASIPQNEIEDAVAKHFGFAF